MPQSSRIALERMILSRNAMFQGVADMVDGEKIIPFVRQFYRKVVHGEGVSRETF